MSLTADIADAIINVDKALVTFELAHNDVPPHTDLNEMLEWIALKKTIVNLQEIACGEGTHFNDVDEARRFHDPRPVRKFGCGGVHSGEMCNTHEVFTRHH